MSSEFRLPTHCYGCGGFLKGGATVHKRECPLYSITTGFRLPDPDHQHVLPNLALIEEEDGWRCPGCFYFHRADITFEKPPAACEDCGRALDPPAVRWRPPANARELP